MTDYSQPDFYRFSEDSIRLVNFVSELPGILPKTVADFGAGCGIIGIEYARRNKPEKVYFLEAQADFTPHLEDNLRSFFPEAISFEFSETLFSKSQWQSMNFDLILSNPPFYLPGHGQVAKDPRKHHCRTFDLDNWDTLLALTKRNLSSEGRAYFVIPNDRHLIRVVEEITSKMGLALEVNSERNLVFLGVGLNKN